MNINELSPEMNALRQGMDWDAEDIGRKQILIETTYGDSHPGSIHLNRLAQMVDAGIKYSGSKPSHFTVTDICDGIAQGHDGMNYSILSRELICAMTETHTRVNVFDGMVVISSCDKSVPAHLMAMARLNMPAIHIPGGVMPMASNGFSLEQIGNANSKYHKNEITACEFNQYKKRRLSLMRSVSIYGDGGHYAGNFRSFGSLVVTFGTYACEHEIY